MSSSEWDEREEGTVLGDDFGVDVEEDEDVGLLGGGGPATTIEGDESTDEEESLADGDHGFL